MLQAVSIACLILVFGLATALPVNMGALAFLAAFALAGLSGITTDEVFGYFPGEVFILVVGITLLFGVARVNGTMELCVEAALRRVGGRRWLVPWVMFFIAGVVMSVGFVLAVGVFAPVAMSLAARYRIRPLLMAMMLSHGALAASLSPTTVFAAFVRSAAKDTGMFGWQMFAASLTINILFAAAIYLWLGRDLHLPIDEPSEGSEPGAKVPAGGALADSEQSTGNTVIRPSRMTSSVSATQLQEDTESAMLVTSTPERLRMTPVRALTLTAIAALVVGAAIGVDLGVMALSGAIMLILLSPNRYSQALSEVSWSVILLICGMLTLMSVLTANGTVQFIANKAAALTPVAAVLCILFVVALLSAVGSSVGTIGIALPLTFPLLAVDSGLPATGVVIAVAVTSLIVDVSPFSTNGALVLAAAQVDDRDRFKNQMLAYTAVVCLLAPILLWLGLVVVPG